MKQTIVNVARGFDLAGLRTARSMTLAVLWKRSRIPYSKLARIEHGDPVELTGDEAHRLASCLHIDERQFAHPRAALLVDREVTRTQRNVGRRMMDDTRIDRVSRHIHR